MGTSQSAVYVHHEGPSHAEPPGLAEPVMAATADGELVRLRDLGPEDVRPNSSSQWDDWGELDVAEDPASQQRALIEVAVPAPTAPGGCFWRPVGDMSWHVTFYGPNSGSRAVNIGISLAPPDRGRGIGSVAQSLLAAAMHDAGVFRVEAQSDVANLGEHRALIRAGFTQEGVIRGAQWRADGRHDLLGFSCLPGEPATTPIRCSPTDCDNR